MKKFILHIILTFSFLPVFAEINPHVALAEFKKSAVQELSVKRDIIEKLSTEITKLTAEIDLLDTKISNLSENSAEKISAFYDARAEEFYNDISEFKKEYPRLQNKRIFEKTSLKEAFLEIDSLLNIALSLTIKPIQTKIDATLVAISDNAKLEGEIFRIGAFEYFINPARAGFVSSDNFLYGEKYAQLIKDFATGKSDKLPVDISEGELLTKEKNSRSFLKEISLGGIWMFPILLLGAVSILVIIEKFIVILRLNRITAKILFDLKNALQNNETETIKAISNKLSYPFDELLSRLYNNYGASKNVIEDITSESILLASEKFNSHLVILSVSAAVSPLLGLLGTITGIIKTFGNLSFVGSAQARLISEGISEALITTEYGLIVAIPAFVAYAIFSRRIKAVISDMEKIESIFLETTK